MWNHHAQDAKEHKRFVNNDSTKMKGKNPMDVTIKCEIVVIHKMWCPSLFATCKVKVQAQKLCSNVTMHLVRQSWTWLHVYPATMRVDTQLQTHIQPTLVHTLLIFASYYPSPWCHTPIILSIKECHCWAWCCTPIYGMINAR